MPLLGAYWHHLQLMRCCYRDMWTYLLISEECHFKCLSSFLHTVKWFQVFLYNSHNLTWAICLHTVCSIWPDQVLALWVRVDLGTMVVKGYSTFSKSPRLEPHHSNCLMSYLGHSLGRGLTPLQRYSWCILQPQLQPQCILKIFFSRRNNREDFIYKHMRVSSSCETRYQSKTCLSTYFHHLNVKWWSKVFSFCPWSRHFDIMSGLFWFLSSDNCASIFIFRIINKLINKCINMWGSTS